jgi:hypothetical protein
MARLSNSRRTAATKAGSRCTVPAAPGAVQVRQTKALASYCALLFFFGASLSLLANDRMVVADFSLGADSRGVPEAWQLAENSGQASLSIAKRAYLDTTTIIGV